jgi:hypothetical protein
VRIGLVVICSTRATRSTIELGGDWVRDAGKLLLLLLEILSGCGGSVLFEPISGFLNGFEDLPNS